MRRCSGPPQAHHLIAMNHRLAYATKCVLYRQAEPAKGRRGPACSHSTLCPAGLCGKASWAVSGALRTLRRWSLPAADLRPAATTRNRMSNHKGGEDNQSAGNVGLRRRVAFESGLHRFDLLGVQSCISNFSAGIINCAFCSSRASQVVGGSTTQNDRVKRAAGHGRLRGAAVIVRLPRHQGGRRQGSHAKGVRSATIPCTERALSALQRKNAPNISP